MDKKNYIDLNYITETLYGDDSFLKEFCEAAILSFSEFKNNFSTYLLDRNETELRKAGHKVKPVAQMLKIDELLSVYEDSKTLIAENEDDELLKQTAEKMDRICSGVLNELKETISKL